MSENSFSGCVDRVDDQVISGWATNAARPDVPAKVSLYIDARVTTIVCEQTRPDAAADLVDRMDFPVENRMKSERREAVYHLLYWDNALHYMFDVKAALEWSRRVLKKSSVFLMDDFVGLDRMQWSDRLLEIDNEVRSQIDPKYPRDPANPARHLPTTVERPDARAIIATNPSECVDSARIIPQLLRIFPTPRSRRPAAEFTIPA